MHTIDWYTATGVAEAIKILEEKDIDLICSDINMRDGTGLDLLQTAKLKCIQSPFILLSGCDYNLDVKLAEQYGAKFIPKGDYELINQIVAIANENKGGTGMLRSICQTFVDVYPFL